MVTMTPLPPPPRADPRQQREQEEEEEEQSDKAIRCFFGTDFAAGDNAEKAATDGGPP